MSAAPDEFHIWERLLQNVRKEIQQDEDGITRNDACIKELHERNEWLMRRLEENRLAEDVLSEKSAGIVRKAVGK
jgi:hypothetical protein